MPAAPPPAEAGHRALPHTADLTIEAWGPTRERCFAEALAAMSSAFVAGDEVRQLREVSFAVAAAGDEELLVALLDEAIFLMDTSGAVPVSARVAAADDGGLAGTLLLGQVAETVGAVPKAVTRHGLVVRRDAGSWRCRVTLDV